MYVYLPSLETRPNVVNLFMVYKLLNKIVSIDFSWFFKSLNRREPEMVGLNSPFLELKHNLGIILLRQD